VRGHAVDLLVFKRTLNALRIVSLSDDCLVSNTCSCCIPVI